jgi:hypothetical protein
MDNDTHIRQKHINKVVIVMPAQGSTPGTTWWNCTAYVEMDGTCAKRSSCMAFTLSLFCNTLGLYNSGYSSIVA